MKKICLTLIILLAAFQFSNAQWTTSGTNIYNSNTGNVGIGATTPTALLSVGSSTVRGTITVTGTATGTPAIGLTDTKTNGHSYTLYSGLSAAGNFDILDQNTSAYRFTINPLGNVGIGTATPADLLDVNGNPVFGSATERISMGSGGFALNRRVATGIIYDNTHFAYQFQHTGSSSAATDYLAFQVYNPSGANVTPYALSINGLGNVGIGTANPLSQLAISGYSSVNPNNTGADIPYSSFTFQNSSSGSNFAVGRISSVQENGDFVDAGALVFYTGYAGLYERLRINTAGNLLIGKTSQANTSYILDVAGNVRANEIVVNTTGADFVFEPAYTLRPLSDLKTYIDQNHHLPEIASAKQMKADGLNLGDNQTKLLQKVEELTLYLIEKDKQVSEQQKQLKSQEERLNKLEKQLEALSQK